MPNSPRNVPKADASDAMYSYVKGLVSEFPGGSIVGELLVHAIAPPLARRMDAFLTGLAADIAELQDQYEALSFENLSTNELFITATVQSAQIAMRNHQELKIDVLKSAVINSAIISQPDEDLVQLYLRYVDDLTVSHIRVLQFFYDPKRWGEENNIQWPAWTAGGVLEPIKHAIPEITEDFARQIIKDLQARGLLADFTPGGTVTESGMFARRATDVGKGFLEFIRKPH